MEPEFSLGKHMALPLMYSYDDIHCDLMGPMGIRAPLYFHPRFSAKLKSIKTQTRAITKSMTSNLSRGLFTR